MGRRGKKLIRNHKIFKEVRKVSLAIEEHFISGN
jgi:hypothetical protein